jgi:hypothetical protein
VCWGFWPPHPIATGRVLHRSIGFCLRRRGRTCRSVLDSRGMCSHTTMSQWCETRHKISSSEPSFRMARQKQPRSLFSNHGICCPNNPHCKHSAGASGRIKLYPIHRDYPGTPHDGVREVSMLKRSIGSELTTLRQSSISPLGLGSPSRQSAFD